MGERTKLAVKGLNLRIFAGEVFGFLGPNGAGKTTTMNVLLGFVPPTAGDASIFGTSVRDPIGRMKVREIIQRIKQEGKTVFFSSHELGEVETVCDRVAIMSNGELKTEGRVAELVDRYKCNLEQVFLNLIDYKIAA